MNHKIPPGIKKISRLPLIGPAVQNSYRHFWYRGFIRNWEKVNADARARLEQNPASLNPAQERAARELRESGIAIASIDELLSAADKPLWDEAREQITAWAEPSSAGNAARANGQKGWKDYIVRYYGHGTHVKTASPLLRLGLSQSILNVANAYLGMWSKLNYVDAWNTLPQAGGDGPTASQRWHRDPEDIKICKIFLYLTDVDDGAGPLHYFPNCRPGDRYGDLWPQELPAGSVVPDAEFQVKAPRSEWRICRGKAGSIVFADTVGFHMGGRATARNRLFCHWAFTTPGGHWPRASIFDPAVLNSFGDPAARWALQ